MLLTVFIVLLALALLLIWFGYYTEQEVYSYIGLAFFLLFGLILGGISIPWLGITDDILIKTGQNTTTTFTYSNTTLTSQTAVSYDNYVTIQDTTTKWIGRYLSILAIIGFVFVLTRREEDAE